MPFYLTNTLAHLQITNNVGVGKGHHQHVKTAGKQSKFGVCMSDIAELVQLADRFDVKVVGLHCHVGSGILDADTWSETANFMGSLSELFPYLRYLDLGGGLGVVEKPSQLPLSMKKLAQRLSPMAEKFSNLQLWMEPGRFLVARSGVLLSRVTQTKAKEGINYIGISTGFNSLVRPTMYGSYHYIVNLTRLNDEGEIITAEVVGPICETGDVLGHARRLHKSEEGDVILIATAGAYGHSMSTNYNLRDPAKEVILREEKQT